MAPTVADMAPPAQRQARRPLSRIVPAIPHRLSRSRNMPAARPITPDESNQGTTTKNEPEPQAEVLQQAKDELPAARTEGAPLTPDSRASNEEKKEEEATVLAASPAKSAEDVVERAPQQTEPDTENKVNGHATPASTSAAASKPAVNGHRKLAVRSELPPPFYPAAKSDTQTPPVDGNAMVPPPSHRSELSAGAAAFTAANGVPSQPATPHAFDQEHPVQQHRSTRPPPGFSAPEHTAAFIPGHSHHPSEVGGPWYPPYAGAQTDALYENGIDHQSPAVPVGHYHVSRPLDISTNGVTSNVESPSKPQFGQYQNQSGSERDDEQRPPQTQEGMVPHMPRFEEPPYELASYLSTQFANPEFADFILQIRSPEAMLVSLPVHGIVVVRSPVIAEAVRRSMPNSSRSRDTRRMLDVLTTDPFVTREALEEAVKVLYGAPLLSPQAFLYGLAPYVYDGPQPVGPSDARMRMRQLLSYIAAGKALQLPSMQARGVEIARLLLRWDTVEEVLQVTLRSTSAFWPKKNGIDAEDPFTAALLNYAVEFMAYTFPVDFSLYALAPELEDIPRLPLLLEARSSTHNPRLSKIRFGDAPPEDDVQPSHVSRALSSMLFSLPLPLLDRLFNHRATANQVGWTGVAKIMRDVIDERESRRKKALKSEIRPAQDGSVPGPLLNNVYMEERVEQVDESAMHPSGFQLIAHRQAGHA
ncbi:hypothetical protein DE146DRAFT_694072 [Phaeosphaeria sp. MPI-PUGE-AT-0046c]|nr:hypothetical protein DE146DRAFT_694072 [Phaeosphaeria sp. MPI-PUGE-AT-0046c]